MPTTSVVVVGSVNIDLVVRTDQRPSPGETVLGHDFEEVLGGKGLNQALGAGRLVPTGLVAMIGADAADRIRALLERSRVTDELLRVTDMPTGRALITVTPDGENSIIVAPMANGWMAAADVVAGLDAGAPSVVLVQREIPVPAIHAAAGWARAHGARFILNASPLDGLGADELVDADPLVVNVHEARAVVGADADLPVSELAALAAARGRSAVVTAGADGAWVADGGGVVHVSGEAGVTVVDTTGAGDEFAGALAGHLASGRGLVEAVRLAGRAAAVIIATPRARRAALEGR